ncbi:unnamed protein product [Mycena citricolor]|uniref:Uncharacterized protein n=1 Tax=Mycena citricolor TaxID=2018698 RepID=A0AAD2HG44_9AGAR|nr:unnamed protein product [Mycena citricolor]
MAISTMALCKVIGRPPLILEDFESVLDRRETLRGGIGSRNTKRHDGTRRPCLRETELGSDGAREGGIRSVVLQRGAESLRVQSGPHDVLQDARPVLAPHRELRGVSVHKKKDSEISRANVGGANGSVRRYLGDQPVDDGLVLPEQDRPVAVREAVDSFLRCVFAVA